MLLLGQIILGNLLNLGSEMTSPHSLAIANAQSISLGSKWDTWVYNAPDEIGSMGWASKNNHGTTDNWLVGERLISTEAVSSSGQYQFLSSENTYFTFSPGSEICYESATNTELTFTVLVGTLSIKDQPFSGTNLRKRKVKAPGIQVSGKSGGLTTGGDLFEVEPTLLRSTWNFSVTRYWNQSPVVTCYLGYAEIYDDSGQLITTISAGQTYP